MSKLIPKRSLGGCLTCKRRKKKCDERKPSCRSNDDAPASHNTPEASSDLIHWGSCAPARQPVGLSSLESLDTLVPLPDYENEVERSPATRALLQEVRNFLSSIPSGVLLDPIILEDATSLIVTQYTKTSKQIMFKPPSGSVERGLLWRIGNSDITRWSMYLGARVLNDISNGNDGQKYSEWIFRFYQQVLEISPSQAGTSLEGRLGGLHDASNAGLFQFSQFTKLAAVTDGAVSIRVTTLYPDILSDDFAISIPEAIQSPHYEITQFIICDTFVSLVLGTPPLLNYNTTPSWVDGAPSHYQLMFGFPVGILLLFAKVNAWRVSRLLGETGQSQGGWQDLVGHLNHWHPTTYFTDGPNGNIMRFAIQEVWRQAAIIYLYMGMQETNSADPRIESAVRQIVQLANVFETDSPLETHLMVPYLIAGVTARQEKHRAVLRGKLASEAIRRGHTLALRGSDFIPVLDHLWHGAGSEGRPIMWEDYVQSRRMVLPVEW
ncbi:unnamed protein product [Rhizoctonia solani]|uniref:Uncharacterized protein n=1 Tax=Rhizoctonia solani TaxID=456999 RepID=A0A8H3CDD7_9AGAM|nr:unnamed protein product [Rhizoctonia solani]